jgi:hypothetical protein
MRKASLIQKDSDEITTVEDLTGVFESRKTAAQSL